VSLALARKLAPPEVSVKALQVVLIVFGTYGLIQVTVQSFRHAYILWVEPRQSVLTEDVGQRIQAARTLDELVARFRDAKRKVEEWERNKSAEELSRADRSREPYQSERMLRGAIEAWEGQHRQISQLHFYWWCGFVALIAGIATYLRVQRWVGASFLIAGFGEMIWWTSPTFRILSAESEFDQLLRWKLIYSLATLVLLLALWICVGAISRRRPNASRG
jgi:hypothetical protein